MRSETSERRLIENEENIRHLNERTHAGIQLVNEYAHEDRQPQFRIDDDKLLRFFCECSDINCKDTIRISLGDYGRVHAERDSFTVKPGHENPAIEEVTSSGPDYLVVRKYDLPS